MLKHLEDFGSSLERWALLLCARARCTPTRGRRGIMLAGVALVLAGAVIMSPRDGSTQPANAPVDAAKTADNATAKTPESPFDSFGNSKNRGPVDVESDSMHLDYKNNAVIFTGNVRAAQADGHLTSNTLNVKYGKDFHDVQQMIADGEVHLSQGLRWCAADHMVMNQAQHTAILTGSPICHDGNDRISGTKITVHTDTGKSEVEGQVKALIFPQESKTRDNEASQGSSK